MKALVLEGVKKLILRDVPRPPCADDGIVIKVMANGVCRSDWHKWMGHYHRRNDPIILGHEFCGVVEEVGSRIARFKPGDRVVVPVAGSDGTCDYCKSGHSNLCDSYLVPGIAYNGGFAEYVAVPVADRNAEFLPDNISYAEASSLGCRFISSYHALTDRARVQLGDWVAVFGCGGVGLAAVNIANAMGANVIGVDINQGNLDYAKQLGAKVVINSEKMDPVAEIKRLTNGGADISMDALGHQITCLQGINSLKKGGCHVQVGITSNTREGDVPMPITDMVHKEISFYGSLGIPIYEMKKLLGLVAQGVITPGKTLAGEISLEEVVPIFERMEKESITGSYVVTKFN
jgi:propanol-preferring alcohol dehydrogenase